ncbi:MAG: hypothetical protein ACI9C1_000081 [Candidatus Aldehydirespiratoraceae bacterium]|jgi:hypothetical protein
MLRSLALLLTLALFAAGCGEDPPSVEPETTVPLSPFSGAADGVDPYDAASLVSFTSELLGADVALSLDETTTGLIGGIRAGECPGSAGDPYDRLVPSSGELYVDEDYIERSLGGSRVIENFDVLGSIVIVADDVTLRCGRLRGSENYSLDIQSDGVVIDWLEASQADSGKTILGGGYDIYRCDISGGEDGLHINRSGVTVTECYIHDQNFIGDDPHPDGIQATSEGTVDYVHVARSKLINFYKAPNAPLQINIADEFSITDSYLWGGVFSILGDPGQPGVVTNNRFGWDSTQFGFLGGVDAERSGNVWWEWVSPKCAGDQSAEVCETPADHPGNGEPVE